MGFRLEYTMPFIVVLALSILFISNLQIQAFFGVFPVSQPSNLMSESPDVYDVIPSTSSVYVISGKDITEKSTYVLNMSTAKLMVKLPSGVIERAFLAGGAAKTEGYILEFREKPILQFETDRKEEIGRGEEKVENLRKEYDEIKIEGFNIINPFVWFSKIGKGSELSSTQAYYRRIEENFVNDVEEYKRMILTSHENFKNKLREEGFRITGMATAKGSEETSKILGEYQKVFNGIALDISEAEAEKLKELPEVKEVYPNLPVNITLMDSVPLINADDVWKLQDSQGRNVTGEGVTIAIIDTGIDYTHPDLGGCFGYETQPPISSNLDSLCKPLYDEHNDENDNRFNFVFEGIKFQNMSEFLEIVRNFIDLNSLDDKLGLFGQEPFKSNKDLFNFWYIGEINDCDKYDYGTNNTCNEKAIENYNLCDVPHRYYFRFFHKDSIAWLPYMGPDHDEWMWAFQPRPLNEPLIDSRGYLVHEFGHAFNTKKLDAQYLGLLLDEYGGEFAYPNYTYILEEGPFAGKIFPNIFIDEDVQTIEGCKENAIWKDLIGYGCGEDGIVDCILNYTSPEIEPRVYEQIACKTEHPDCYKEISCFEGALGFEKGVFRSSYDSIMNTGGENLKTGFNLPSQRHFCRIFESELRESEGVCEELIESEEKECKVVGGYDFANNDEDPMDDHGHGTHCAGIAAGNGALKGVAPNAKLYGYKVLDSGGSGWFDDIIAGIEMAVDPNQDGDFSDHVDVISMSLGASCGGSYSEYCGPDDPMSNAVDNAVEAGVVVVIAAGNSGPGEGTIGSPGTARKAITVGATYKKDYTGQYWSDIDPIEDQITSFSSRGPVISEKAGLVKPDILAPGAMICAARYDEIFPEGYHALYKPCYDDDHLQLAGTSMSTPHMAGVVALLKQKNPGWTPDEIKASLKSTAVDLNYTMLEQGYGRVDVLKAAELDEAPPVAIIETSGKLQGNVFDITGTASGENLVNYTLYYKEGYDYDSHSGDFAEIITSNNPVQSGVLGQIDTENMMTDYEGSIKLTLKLVSRSQGQQSEDRVFVIMKNNEITHPLDLQKIWMSYNKIESIFPRWKGKIQINGTSTGYDFDHYEIEWCFEATCKKDGITLVNGGSQAVEDGLLGEWDISSLAKTGYYTIKLHKHTQEGYIRTTESMIYVDTKLHNGWPKSFDLITEGIWALSMVDQPTIADIDNNGNRDLVVAYGVEMHVYNSEGESVEGWPKEITTNYTWSGGVTRAIMQTGPSVGDLDDDGYNEIVIGDNAGYLHVFNHDGTYVNGWPKMIPCTGSSIADVNGDGNKEIIFGNWGGYMHVVDINGEELDGWPRYMEPGFSPVWMNYIITPPSIADINKDGYKDIIVKSTACEYVSESYGCGYDNQNSRVWVLNYTGGVLDGWPVQTEIGNPVAGQPVITDINNDNELEVLFMDMNDTIHVLDKNGNYTEGWPVKTGYDLIYIDNFIVADIDNDGEIEIGFSGEENISWRYCVYVYEHDGTLLEDWPVCYGYGDSHYNIRSGLGYVMFGNMDSDPEIEISTKSNGGGFSQSDPLFHNYAFNLDTSFVENTPKLTDEMGFGEGFPMADLDGDGYNELVAYTWGGYLYVWDLDGLSDNRSWSEFYKDPRHTSFYGYEINATMKFPNVAVSFENIGNKYVINREYNITVRLKNIGSNDTGQINIALYDNQDIVSQKTVNKMTPGSEGLVNFTWTPKTHGSHELKVLAETPNDRNPNNNKDIVVIQVFEKLVDVTGKLETEKYIKMGGKTEVNVTVKNAGVENATDTRAKLYDHTPNGTDVLIWEETIGELGPGELKFTFSWTPSEPGIHTLRLIVNASNDEDQANNVQLYDVHVQLEIPDVTGYMSHKTRIILGEELNITIYVRNIGLGNATNTSAKLYYTNEREEVYTLIKSFEVGKLSKDEEKEIITSWKPSERGGYILKLVVDCTGDLELSNNVFNTYLQVVENVPDVYVSMYFGWGKKIVVGKEFNVSLSVGNNGAAKAKDVKVKLFYKKGYAKWGDTENLTLVDEVDVGGLDAGSWKLVGIGWTPMDRGEYTLLAMVNCTNETEYYNNINYGFVDVIPDAPDVTGYVTGGDIIMYLLLDEETEINVTARSIGTKAAKNVTVSMYYAKGSIIYIGGGKTILEEEDFVLVEKKELGEMPVDEERDLKFSWEPNETGDFTLLLVFNCSGDENFENNRVYRMVYVAPDAPDVKGTITWRTSYATVNQTNLVYFNVENVGGREANNVNVSLYSRSPGNKRSLVFHEMINLTSLFEKGGGGGGFALPFSVASESGVSTKSISEMGVSASYYSPYNYKYYTVSWIPKELGEYVLELVVNCTDDYDPSNNVDTSTIDVKKLVNITFRVTDSSGNFVNNTALGLSIPGWFSPTNFNVKEINFTIPDRIGEDDAVVLFGHTKPGIYGYPMVVDAIFFNRSKIQKEMHIVSDFHEEDFEIGNALLYFVHAVDVSWDYSEAELYVDANLSQYNAQNESPVSIYSCSNWEFAERECESDWVSLNTTQYYSMYKYAKVDSTEAFGLGEFREAPPPPPPPPFVSFNWSEISPGGSALADISHPDIDFTNVFFRVNKRVTNVILSMRKLPDKPSGTASVSGKSYKYFDLNPVNINDADLTEARIKFKVSKSWISKNNIDKNSVYLYRYRSSEWKKLETTKVKEDSIYVYYQANIPGFSFFAITGMETSLACDNDNVCDLGENSGNCPNDCQCVSSETRSCAVARAGICSVGSETCVNSRWTGCPSPQTETCNRKDDDCDGTVDDVNNGNSVASAGCQCYNNGQPKGEECNGIDDDCDGKKDEDMERTCGPDNIKGVCKQGISTCVNGEWSDCIGAVYPEHSERCGNNLDDNCDGQVNEGCETCYNGKQDGDEEGMDCGGSCPPCPMDISWVIPIVTGVFILFLIMLIFFRGTKKREREWDEMLKEEAGKEKI